VIVFLTVTACAKSESEQARDYIKSHQSKVQKPVFQQNPYKKHDIALLYTSKSSSKSILTLDLTCARMQKIPHVGECKFVNSAQANVGVWLMPGEGQISTTGANQPLEMTLIGKIGKEDSDIKVIATVPIPACSADCPNIQFPGNQHPLATHALITSSGVAAQIGLQPGLEVAIDTPPE
jgi:hypothetical protein